MFTRIKSIIGPADYEADSTTGFSLISAATANLTLVKVGPGYVTSIIAIGQTAAVRYLKFYDMNTVPVAGRGTPVRRYSVPGSTTGAGFVYQPQLPMRFNYGIAFVLVAGTGLDADTTATAANDVILTLEYV